MVCNCCKLFLKEKFEELGLVVKEISLGKARIIHPAKKVSHEAISSMLAYYGFDLVHSREDRIIEEIKLAVIELVHHLNNVNSIVRKSDYIVEKLGLSYQYLSKVFSEHEHHTLEKYIILQKIERIKHLLKNGDNPTVSQYKESDRSFKIGIESL